MDMPLQSNKKHAHGMMLEGPLHNNSALPWPFAAVAMRYATMQQQPGCEMEENRVGCQIHST